MSCSMFEDQACEIILNDFVGKYSGQNRYGFEYERESCVRYANKKRGRFDLVVKIIELKRFKICKTIHYEMKSCMSDLKSGRGINFHGDYNYLVYPRDSKPYVRNGTNITFEKAKEWLEKHGYDRVGIICLREDGTLSVEREAFTMRAKAFV